jgi:hypothetical protein
MPSATGVRIAGDDYQWLHAWRTCMEIVHEQATGNTTNPGIAVGIEEPGVGNGDDVVRHRSQPPHAYIQVKYAVDNRTPVGLTYLDDEKILRKLVATHQALTGSGTPVEMRLVTNRLPDPNELLLKDRDGRDGRLLPRAAQGGPNSDRAKARADWANAAGTDEETLLKFLESFHLDIGYDTDRLQQAVSLLMSANGLRSDPAAITLGTGWIQKEVIAGHRRLHLDDITGAIENLHLRTGEPWLTISIATVDHDPVADQAIAAIDWVDRIEGDNPFKKVIPAPPATWDDLGADIQGLRQAIGLHRRVLITGYFRQATGFYTGCELRAVYGYHIGHQQRDQLWTSDASASTFDLTTTTRSLGDGPDLALIVNVSTDATPAVNRWLESQALPIGEVVSMTPTSGTGPNSVPTPEAAQSLAIAIRDTARHNGPRDGEVHLFLAGPLGLSLLLGHSWNRVATTHVYEHLGGTDYMRAFTINA